MYAIFFKTNWIRTLQLKSWSQFTKEYKMPHLPIRCPKCTSGSLSSSNAPISEDLKQKIAEMINSNKTDNEIKEYVTKRFGKDSLYEPEFSRETYILWFSPFLVLILGLFFFLLRRKI